MLSKISSGKIVSSDSMRKGVSFIDWDGVSNSITRVDNETSSSTGGVEGENSLDGYVPFWDIECLEENGAHSFSVGSWVSWSFGQQTVSIFWGYSEFVEEAVMPYFLHVGPISDDSMSNRVVKFTDTSLGLGFVTNEFGLST